MSCLHTWSRDCHGRFFRHLELRWVLLWFSREQISMHLRAVSGGLYALSLFSKLGADPNSIVFLGHGTWSSDYFVHAASFSKFGDPYFHLCDRWRNPWLFCWRSLPCFNRHSCDGNRHITKAQMGLQKFVESCENLSQLKNGYDLVNKKAWLIAE